MYEHVNATVHGNLVPRVERSGESREQLGHDGREQQVPCC